MKQLMFIFGILILGQAVSGQSDKKLLKSWIKVESVDLSGNAAGPDTIYTRYSFGKERVNISFYPAWDDFDMNYSLQGNQIIIGVQSYTIDELTDSTFTIQAPGFRLLKFKAEGYLCQHPGVLRQIGEKNSLPLYEATDTLSPRYTKGKLDMALNKYSNGYNVIQASYFRMEFTITENGKVEDVVVTKSISYGFDKGMVEGITKTSGKWKPAYCKGKPVQTRMFFERRYLNSSGMGRTSGQ
ncbi:energy transducer TonB [Flavihumibacter petaseus]|uniref:TonB C-terminal domain-containing protein n=1 Tax=Flavihumibacter petaseus NBRC 106054 TaxID=1220578 RepID=A0A0E9MWF1_9BACT|nr:energy transducer TonB [Flavihumibacter petaseus]GAO41766.1 hypothetical protein FPE01S_01_07800 [Flavihumibacter petaseus NBRC 106054]